MDILSWVVTFLIIVGILPLILWGGFWLIDKFVDYIERKIRKSD